MIYNCMPLSCNRATASRKKQKTCSQKYGEHFFVSELHITDFIVSLNQKFILAFSPQFCSRAEDRSVSLCQEIFHLASSWRNSSKSKVRNGSFVIRLPASLLVAIKMELKSWCYKAFCWNKWTNSTEYVLLLPPLDIFGSKLCIKSLFSTKQPEFKSLLQQRERTENIYKVFFVFSSKNSLIPCLGALFQIIKIMKPRHQRHFEFQEKCRWCPEHVRYV